MLWANKIPVFGGRPEHPLTLSALASMTTTTTTSTRHRCRPSAPVPVRPGDRTTPLRLLPRRRPRCRPTFPGSRLVRRADAAPCVLRNSALEPQFPATSGGSSHRTKLSFALHGLTDLVLTH